MSVFYFIVNASNSRLTVFYRSAFTVEGILFTRISTGVIRIANDRFEETVRPLFPLIEATAAEISRLAEINYAVHKETYDRLIHEIEK